MIEGFISLATSNKAFTNFADSPTHLEIKSAAETEKKVAWNYAAHAFAK